MSRNMLKNMLNNANAPTRSYIYEFWGGSGLNRMIPGMTAQFWVDMGSFDYIQDKNEGF
jgi:hypothetical protein